MLNQAGALPFFFCLIWLPDLKDRSCCLWIIRVRYHSAQFVACLKVVLPKFPRSHHTRSNVIYPNPSIFQGPTCYASVCVSWSKYELRDSATIHITIGRWKSRSTLVWTLNQPCKDESNRKKLTFQRENVSVWFILQTLDL
jgi:hypothetical protein